MPNTSLTEKKIKKRVETRLGSSGVVIEIEDDDLKECMEQALEVYNQMRPHHRHGSISVTKSQKRYVLTGTFPPAGSDQTLAGVLDVQFLSRRSKSALTDPFDPFYTTGVGASLGTKGGSTYGELEQQIGYAEAAERIVDAEPEWEGVWEGSDYVLYIDIPRSHIQMGFQYSCYYDNTDGGRQLIPLGDVDWFMKFCTAVAKQILGRIRVKFGGIANPEGGTDEIDGSELIREGAEEEERLREELNRRRVPLGPTSPA